MNHNWSGRCLTCKHWKCNKQKQLGAIQNCIDVCGEPTCMDLKKGWPEDGLCGKIICEGVHVEVSGDACAEIFFDANFGCIHWESD